MFGYEQAAASFTERFEEVGSDILFRASLKAAPVRLSLEERDGALAAFKKGYWISFAALMVGFIIVCVVPVLVFEDIDAPNADMALWGGIIFVSALFALFWYRIWTAPNRQFANKAPAGPAMSFPVARREAMSRISYLQLFSTAAVAVVLGASHILASHVSPIERWGWSVGVTAFLMLAGVQAIRKWRAELKDDL